MDKLNKETQEFFQRSKFLTKGLKTQGDKWDKVFEKQINFIEDMFGEDHLFAQRARRFY